MAYRPVMPTDDDTTGDGAAKPDGGLVEATTSTEHQSDDGLRWTATAGTWILRDDSGTAKCSMSFVSYETETDAAAQRPVMFVFNGGPGSSSIWLHLGLFGPRRIDLGDGLRAPAAPYELVDNPASVLPVTDLVFIDPVGTGFGRPAEGVETKEFHGLEQDAKWVGEFIRTWLSRRGRWGSPKFLAGESYGTMRAAAMARTLGDQHGITMNGIVLISTVVSMATLYGGGGNDLPYVLALPTLAATAYNHGRTGPGVGDSLEAVVATAESFALDDYARALLREHLLDDDDRRAVASRLSELTGIEESVLLRNRLRLPKERFRKELLRDAGVVVGHFDSRITTTEADAGDDATSDDASYWTVRFPFSGAWHHYLRHELGVDQPQRYEVLDPFLGRDWVWGEAGTNQYVDTAAWLRDAMLRDRDLAVFMANGYFDFATPFFAAEWSLEHLSLPTERRAAMEFRRYRAGHMMYTDQRECTALANDIRDFLLRSLKR